MGPGPTSLSHLRASLLGNVTDSWVFRGPTRVRISQSPGEKIRNPGFQLLPLSWPLGVSSASAAHF
jgi:hypothetical protein